jgi:hypothetical protein
VNKACIAWIAGSFLLFAAVLPPNHSEAEDAFEYSRLVEEGQGATLFHPHHLLYLPLQKGIYATAQALGYGGRAYYTARAVSMAAGAFAIGLFYLLVCRLQHPGDRRGVQWIPALSAAGLLFSYGFVRYACEVEIYVPAAALALGALYAALHPSGSVRWSAAGIVLASLALLMHSINAALALGVIPLCYWFVTKARSRAVIHLIATGLFVGAAYALAHFACGLYRPPLDTASEGGLQSATVWKAAVGFGQCLMSANFVFAYEAVADALQQLFPYRMFTEELFTVLHMPSWLKWTAPLTFACALAALALSACVILWHACRRRRIDWVLPILVLWLGGTMLPTLLLEPSNPELWILVLPPLWSLFAWFGGGLAGKKQIKYVLLPAVVLLGVHNLSAGMGLIRSAESDYHYKKAAWALQHAGAGDVLVTADSFVFSFYLNYWSEAEVRNANKQEWRTGKRTYVFDDVFNHPEAIGIRYPDQARHVDAVADQLRGQTRKLHDDSFGGIWMVEESRPD